MDGRCTKDHPMARTPLSLFERAGTERRPTRKALPRGDTYSIDRCRDRFVFRIPFLVGWPLLSCVVGDDALSLEEA